MQSRLISVNQSIKNKYISLPRNRYNVLSIYLQCLQLSSYKYFILTKQTMSSNTICPIEKICFSYYLKGHLQKKGFQELRKLILRQWRISSTAFLLAKDNTLYIYKAIYKNMYNQTNK